MKTVTIFGGTGFIGTYAVQALAKDGWRVRVATRIPESANGLKPFGSVGQIVPVACRLSDPASIAAAIRGSDCVVNCVGILNERGKATFTRLHVDAPRRIAEACAANDIKRFVHISALGLEGRSRYAQSKKKGEQAIAEAYKNVIILRPSVVFGTEDKFFNKFSGMARLLPFLPLIGGGRTKLQPVYVGDVARAILACLDTPDGDPRDPRGKVYELGGPEVMDFRAIYNEIFAATGIRRPTLPIPFWVAKIDGAILSLLPNPVVTKDQVESLKTDAVVAPGALTLRDLDIVPTATEIVVPDYLARYRTGGRFRMLEKSER